jgi:hypothetical protein
MKILLVLLMAMALVCAYAAPGMAGKADDPVTNVVTGSVNTVGKAAEGTVKTVAAPVEALGDSMKGEGTPDKIITGPVEKGGETVYDATVNTGKTVTGQKVE